MGYTITWCTRCPGGDMATAKKHILSHLPKTLVSYRITDDKRYLVMTNNESVVSEFERFGMRMTYQNHAYHLIVDELPQSEVLEFKQYRVKHTTPEQRSELEREVDRLRDMDLAIEEMMKLREGQEKLLQKMVRARGLHLKPHLPRDSEMFSPKHHTRFHLKMSVQQNIDQQAISDMVEKHPVLKKCFKRHVSYKFDRAEFTRISRSLEPSVLEKIVSYSEIESFHEYELPNAECMSCGGTFTKKGICKHCGLPQEKP